MGRDILTLQLGWPLGMPLARKLEPALWEIRTRLEHATARVLFTVRDESIVLLHGFIKKTQKAPADDLRLARQRLECQSASIFDPGSACDFDPPAGVVRSGVERSLWLDSGYAWYWWGRDRRSWGI